MCVYHVLAQEPTVRFDSPEEATSGKSTWEVFRGWLVFKLLTYDFLVDHSLRVRKMWVLVVLVSVKSFVLNFLSHTLVSQT